MNKEAYYFSHDSNARQDEKILDLRMKLGWEGYGIYWALVEKLREASDYSLLKNYNIISFDLRVDAAIIKSIIEDFGLFVFTENGEYFYSERMHRNMTAKSNKGKKAAEARWSKKNKEDESQTVTYLEPKKNTSAMQVHASAMQNDAIKVKESKVKKSKQQQNKAADVFDDFISEIKKGFHDQWAEATYMRLKIKKGSLTPLLSDFKNQLIIDSKTHKCIQELRMHLNNWLNKQNEVGKLKQYKLKS